jgi:hypothetical protein
VRQRTGVVICMHTAHQQGLRQEVGGSTPVHSMDCATWCTWDGRLWVDLPGCACGYWRRSRLLPHPMQSLLLLLQPAVLLPLVLLLSHWHCTTLFKEFTVWTGGGCVHSHTSL